MRWKPAGRVRRATSHPAAAPGLPFESQRDSALQPNGCPAPAGATLVNKSETHQPQRGCASPPTRESGLIAQGLWKSARAYDVIKWQQYRVVCNRHPDSHSHAVDLIDHQLPDIICVQASSHLNSIIQSHAVRPREIARLRKASSRASDEDHQRRRSQRFLVHCASREDCCAERCKKKTDHSDDRLPRCVILPRLSWLHLDQSA